MRCHDWSPAESLRWENVTSLDIAHLKASGLVESLERRTIRRVMIRIIPFIFVLYIVAFLDRINIAFAALSMNAELGVTSEQYGLLVGIFFLGYFAFEIPSNLLLHRVGARIWIARILVSWGLLASLTGLAQNVGHLYGLPFSFWVLLGWLRRALPRECCCISPTGFPVAHERRLSACISWACPSLRLSVHRFPVSFSITSHGSDSPAGGGWR